MAKVLICNKCGRPFDEWDINNGFSIKSHIGYGSEHDGSFLDLDLCCSCMDELIDSCRISPVDE